MAENQQPYHFKLITGEGKFHDEVYTLNIVIRKNGLRRMVSTGIIGKTKSTIFENELY